MRMAICLIAGFAMSGCATFQKQAAVNPLTVIEAKAEYCSALNAKYAKQDAKILTIFDSICFEDSNSKLSPQDYTLNLMMIADMVCARELRNLSANQRTVNAAFSTASTAFSATAGVVTGGTADNILNGLATLSGSTRDHLGSAVYRGAQPELITRLIQADRERIAREIAKEIGNSSSDVKYSSQKAVFEANRYHQSCSYFHGLSLLVDAASKGAEDIDKK